MYTYFHNNYLYSVVEMQRFALEPYRQIALKNKDFLNKYCSGNKYGRTLSASFELFERVTRNYQKPEFKIEETSVGGKKVKIKQKTISTNTFCNLLHFEKEGKSDLPKMLVVAPMSGHYATLLRGTVKGLLPHFDVYITDWVNARDISVEEGFFTFDDFVSYVINYLRQLGPHTNVMAVCQPSVPVSVAVAMMSKAKDKCVPDSMILMGGPIDTRKNPTEVNDYAADRTIRWFESNVITKVPVNYAGAGRSVYPGFMQLYGFLAMNLQTHVEAHWDFFNHLVEGDGDSAESHKNFYNEYLSVMDLPAEFYLETVNLVFKKHLLPRGKLVIDGEKVTLSDIDKTALLCIEGEKDDISGRGQTKAAIDLCTSIPNGRKKYHLQKNVGHYGIFNGRRYREYIVPIIVDFVAKNALNKSATKTVPAKVEAKKAVATSPSDNPVNKSEESVKPVSQKKAPTPTLKPKQANENDKTANKSVKTKPSSKIDKASDTAPKKEVLKEVKKVSAAKISDKKLYGKRTEPEKTSSVSASSPVIIVKPSSQKVVPINNTGTENKTDKPTPVKGKTGGTKK
ncbi:MAG: hypothetical protein COV35_03900 [Alphaproteobacteria bacterium CG11_big_fil_rev_8_21_14_0_20_39_49]|nr:MAG: hypothetical protein COV35_03900 [Alphaproteobacteria bacterium CG11_big_fil_rev_8_21_14_0_20_39_49]